METTKFVITARDPSDPAGFMTIVNNCDVAHAMVETLRRMNYTQIKMYQCELVLGVENE